MLKMVWRTCKLLIAWFLPIPALSQWFWSDSTPGAESGRFSHQLLLVPTGHPDTVRTVVFGRVDHDQLQFVKTDSGFTARYELTVEILDPSANRVAGEIQRIEVHADRFAQTNAMDRTSKTRFQTNLAPGEYTACLELYDVESKAFLRRKDPFRIRKSDLSRLSVGPLFFFRRSGEFDPLAEFPFPEFPPVRSMDDSAFSALGFLLLDRPSSEAVVQAKLCRGTDAPVLADSFRVPLIRPIQPFAIPIPPSLDFGTYELTVRAEVPGDTAQARTVLFVQWGSHPSERADPRFTVEPLAYIMDRREFKRLQALDPDDQRKAVDAYWESKNPDRSAFINPLEREFYQRVRFANRYFSMFKGGLEGWRLDRGRIYILYGPPESVERPAGSMVEAWFYPDIPKRFLFVDRYGTGRFDLVREIDE